MSDEKFSRLFWTFVNADESYDVFKNQINALLSPERENYLKFVKRQFDTYDIDHFIDIVHKNDPLYFVDIIVEDEVDGLGVASNNAHARWLSEKESDLSSIKYIIVEELNEHDRSADTILNIISGEDKENKKQTARLSQKHQALILYFLDKQGIIKYDKISEVKKRRGDFLSLLFNNNADNFYDALEDTFNEGYLLLEKSKKGLPLNGGMKTKVFTLDNLKKVLEVFNKLGNKEIRKDIEFYISLINK